MSNVLVTLGNKTDWLDPLRWWILARIAKKPGSRVANVMVGDSIVEERALQSLVDAGWAIYRDDTVERPLAGPNVYLTEVGEEAVRSGNAWIRSIGTPKTGNRTAWRGASKGMKASNFDARELRRGTKSEKAEHGLPTSTARRIAMDHLAEDPRYYSKNRAVPLASVLAGTGVPPRATRRFPPSDRFTAFAMDTGGTAHMVYQGPSLSTAREKAEITASRWQTPVTVVDQQWNEIKTYRPDEGVPDTTRNRSRLAPQRHPIASFEQLMTPLEGDARSITVTLYERYGDPIWDVGRSGQAPIDVVRRLVRQAAKQIVGGQVYSPPNVAFEPPASVASSATALWIDAAGASQSAPVFVEIKMKKPRAPRSPNRTSHDRKPGVELITLPDGRVFPVYNGEPLSWDVNSQATLSDEKEGYPRTKTVVRAMIQERPEQLHREKSSLLRGSFDRMFGHNARKLLAVIESTERESSR